MYYVAHASTNLLQKGQYRDGFADLDDLEAFLTEE
jgi:hypothetical protein